MTIESLTSALGLTKLAIVATKRNLRALVDEQQLNFQRKLVYNKKKKKSASIWCGE
jgi:hypothetical protein